MNAPKLDQAALWLATRQPCRRQNSFAAVSTGTPPIMPELLPNKAHPFIGGATAATENLLGQLFPSLPQPSATPQVVR